MSGPQGWRGEDAFEGADLAVHILNRDLGTDEPGFELVTLDDGGDVATAVDLIKEQAAAPRVAGIVYAGPLEAVPETEEVLADAGIPLIACYGDLFGARLLSPHVFQVSPSLLWEARRIASYFLKDRRYTRVGMLSGDDLFGRTARQAFTNALADEGGRLVASETFPSEGQDFTAELHRLRSKRVQALFVPAPPTLLATVLKELDQMGAGYTTTLAARSVASAKRKRRGPWRPQIATADIGIAPQIDVSLRPGLVASDSYGRGAHYLPIPSLVSFRTAFENWWGDRPLGWEQRSYEAVRLIGEAVDRAADGDDLAVTLEGSQGERLGGLDVNFGPDDHVALDQATVGLWVVPSSGARVPERGRLPETMPWVPLERGFSTDGERTDIYPEDWRYLFRHSPPASNPPPRFERARFGVITSRKDPVH
jgi:ABC-type branched-subunit amino acid transport system substrate-binding protein